jgi:hypothetical protein
MGNPHPEILAVGYLSIRAKRSLEKWFPGLQLFSKNFTEQS